MKKQKIKMIVLCMMFAAIAIAGCNDDDSDDRFQLKVQLTSSGQGIISSNPAGINCGSICSADFDKNTDVTLSAVPADGFYFVSWGGECTGTGDCQVTMTKHITVTAEFAEFDPNDTISLTEVSTYETGLFDEAAAEISAFDPKSRKLFVVNANSGRIDVLSVGQSLTGVAEIDLSAYGAGANSVAFDRDILAVAVEADDKQAPGAVVFFDADGNYLNSVTVGALPDMLTFTPDGNKVVVANEGEPDDAYVDDPEGSISIIDISGGIAGATVATADFSDFNNQAASLMAKGVRVYGPGASLAQDMEPEYIAVSPDSATAWVACQENNAIAEVNLATATVTKIHPLGFKDHSIPGNGMDASNKDDAIHIRTWPVLGMYLPDAITAFSINGETYLISANEGDSRDYGGFSEEERVEDIDLDTTAFADAATLQLEENLGRLKITTTLGDTDNDGDFDALYAYGGRSFSIWKPSAAGLELIFDSGDQLEQITAGLIPEMFNASNDENGYDDRSDDKGPEPEGVAVGVINGHTYAFIGLERVGGIMVYDITDPDSPRFIEYVTNRNPDGDPETGTAGDLAPEGLLFIPKSDSPSGKPLLIVTNEVSGSTTMYEISEKAGNEVAFAVITDPHYYDSDLGVTGSAFEAYLAQDRKMIAESGAILDATVATLAGNSNLSFTIVCGDLTKDGELTSHQEFAAKMAVLEQSGIDVYVVPGNHDINNPHAFSYNGDATVPVDTVSPAEFADIYADFGYDDALYRDTDSLSYVAEPSDGLYLLALDSCKYEENMTIGKPETGGNFSAATLAWITSMLDMAESRDKQVIATMHHGLLEHFTGQSVAEPGSEYVIENFQTISQTLADAGLGLVFTGHYHAHDMTSNTAGKLLDVETGSLVTYPCPYRLITLDTDDSVRIESRYITDIDYNTGNTDFPTYARAYLADGLTDIAYVLMVTPVVSGGYGLEPAVANVLAPEVTTAYMAHYSGDEWPDSITSASIAAYAGSTDPTTQLLGQTLGSLWTDLPPRDAIHFYQLP